jgi:RND family efflux transporter MFP subunit
VDRAGSDCGGPELKIRSQLGASRGDTTSGKKAIVLALLFISVGFLASCAKDQRVVASTPETVRNLPIITAQTSELPDLLEAVGTVQAAQTSLLASQVMGTILEIRVREGDRVQRGQVVAVIDDAQPRAALERAAAARAAAQQEVTATDSDLTLAESTLKRYQILYEQRIVSSQEFDEIKARQQSAHARRDLARARLEQANAEMTQAQTTLDYTRIGAPFDAVVTEKRADPGTLALPGMPIFTVEDVHRYRLEATVNESDLRYLRLGQQVPVMIEALDHAEMKARVAQIVPAADSASRSFLVKIELPPDARLRSGLFGRAQFARGDRQSLVIPRTAVVVRGQLQGVFVLDQNQVASLRYIATGKSSATNVEVLSGLQRGDRVVANPGELDLSGKRVEVD